MKISIQKATTLFVVVLAAVFAFTIVSVHAEEATVNANANLDVRTRTPIRTEIDARIEQNREVRNTMLDRQREVNENMKDMRNNMQVRRASTTDMFKRNATIRKEIAKKMETKAFEIRKNALLRELNISIFNLTNISTRIDSRIAKAESEGRVLLDAKALLVIANEKLAKARIDVAAFQALKVTPPSTSSSGTETSVTGVAEVELVKPRALGDAAIKSVKDARDAFQKVVVAIAHVMGLKLEGSATTSTTVTN